MSRGRHCIRVGLLALALTMAGCTGSSEDRVDAASDKLVFDAAWAPDGKRVAFTGGRFGEKLGLWVTAVDGSTLTRLTPRWLEAGAPRWSPDGQRLLFVSGTADLAENPRRDLYVVGADGEGLRRLTHNRVDDTMAEWSPDGTRIAFACHAAAGYGVCTVRPDGTGLRRVTSGRPDDRSPTWSPDGGWIGFVRGDRGLGLRVCVIRATGSGLRCPARASEPYYLTWSPRGSALAAEDAGVVIVDAATGVGRRLLGGGSLYSEPAWAPDGRRLVFQVGEDVYSRKRIVLADVRTGRLRRLGFGWGGMDWSPDGERLVLADGDALYLIDVATGSSTLLPTPFPGPTVG